MRRAMVSGINRTKVLDSLTIFSGAARIEGVHPLQFGFFRRKLRTQRRSGMPMRQSAGVLSVARARFSQSAVAMGAADLALSPHHGAGDEGSGREQLFRRGVAAAYRRRRDRSFRRSLRRQDSAHPRRAGARRRGGWRRRRIRSLSAPICRPILLSVPATSRAILARCMIQSSTASSRNNLRRRQIAVPPQNDGRRRAGDQRRKRGIAGQRPRSRAR